MIQDAARAPERRVGGEDLSLAMGTRPEEASSLDRSRRDRDLLHDHPGFLVGGGGRPRNRTRVISPRAESEEYVAGDRQHPAGEPGCAQPDAEDPSSGREYVEELYESVRLGRA